MPNGDKILKLIFQQYQPLQKKITWLENKRLISNNSKDYDVSQGLLKTTDSIKASQNSSSEHLEFLLEHNSEKILIEELQSILPGTPTGFKIGEVDLTFPGGAISIIAAPTSHGKTSALINFCLGALNSNHDQYVHFFTYEESTASILISFSILG